MTPTALLAATVASPALDELCINTLRFLAVDMVQKANSGHPGLPMGSATMAYTLWDRSLKFNPNDPLWPDRDRFVLSAGHGCALQYALLHVTGFDLSLDELKRFRQWGSRTPGHPEYGKTPGIEATTGPLGQGLANGVGMAIAEVALAAHFNRPGHMIVDHFTYVLVSDGDLEEGISSEAGSEAGHLHLGKLIVLYADNHITIEGSTELAFTEDRTARFASFGWHVQQVERSNDVDAVALSLKNAREESTRPSLIAIRTHIGFGSPNKQDTAKAHGEALGGDALKHDVLRIVIELAHRRQGGERDGFALAADIEQLLRMRAIDQQARAVTGDLHAAALDGEHAGAHLDGLAAGQYDPLELGFVGADILKQDAPHRQGGIVHVLLGLLQAIAQDAGVVIELHPVGTADRRRADQGLLDGDDT